MHMYCRQLELENRVAPWKLHYINKERIGNRRREHGDGPIITLAHLQKKWKLDKANLGGRCDSAPLIISATGRGCRLLSPAVWCWWQKYPHGGDEDAFLDQTKVRLLWASFPTRSHPWALFCLLSQFRENLPPYWITVDIWLSFSSSTFDVWVLTFLQQEPC